MSASIYDVAKRAGVSISTVSRILNSSAGVSEKKRIAVEEAMAYFKYEPNQFARGLVKQTSGMIGVCFPEPGDSIFESSYNLELLKGIEKELMLKSYSMVLLNETGNTRREVPRYLEYIRQKRIDGILLSGLSDKTMKEKVFDQVMEEDYPVVYIGKRIHKKGLNVYAQFEQYSLEAIRQLRKAGHRRVLFFIYEMHLYYLSEIRRGIAGEMPDMEVVFTALSKSEGIRSRLSESLRSAMKEGCTAACTPGVEVLQQLMSVCGELSLEIPRQLSVVSVEHKLGEGEHFFPRISTFFVPAREMGRGAARLLIKRIEEGAVEDESVEYTTNYIERDSVRRV